MAGIIKASGGPSESSTTQGAVFNFEDMNQRAKQYLLEVKEQAKKIIEEARHEAEAIRQQSQREGQREAKRLAQEELKNDLQQKMQTALPALQKSAELLVRQRELWESHWEHEAVRLSVRIAEKIVRRQMEIQPRLPLTWIKETLDLISHQEQVTVELSPEDFDALGQHISTISEALGRAAPTRLVSNPQLEPGDCRLTTQFGEIDMSLETQLIRLESELS